MIVKLPSVDLKDKDSKVIKAEGFILYIESSSVHILAAKTVTLKMVLYG
jgi:hypothetical protein